MLTIAKPRRILRQSRSLQTVEHILNATRSALARITYQEVTTKRIAREPGLSVGALYAFFPDKASIIDKIAGQHNSAVRSGVENEVVKPALWERPLDAVALIRRALEIYVAYLDEHADFRGIEFGQEARETRRLEDGFAANGITAVLCAFCYIDLRFDSSPRESAQTAGGLRRRLGADVVCLPAVDTRAARASDWREHAVRLSCAGVGQKSRSFWFGRRWSLAGCGPLGGLKSASLRSKTTSYSARLKSRCPDTKQPSREFFSSL